MPAVSRDSGNGKQVKEFKIHGSTQLKCVETHHIAEGETDNMPRVR